MSRYIKSRKTVKPKYDAGLEMEGWQLLYVNRDLLITLKLRNVTNCAPILHLYYYVLYTSVNAVFT